ncbi:DUF4136 domain-containing protein [Brevundimonas lenta]|uniref:DUF4136 domain-containing protein n=1 Tax=Brevundimonas lenta TaxID=424796 RepID=A0A7W6JCX9_9CAUL|nr:DUF4136 domain-containing protein [Brevundimonas lenta]MBB4082838.1 hypothetical protein [Brevundimonas lenta]
MTFPSVRTAATVVAVSLLSLTACGTPAGDVSVLQSSTQSVIPGSTYAWAPFDPTVRSSADPRVANDIIQQRITSAFDAAMVARGFQRVSDPQQATLLVSYHIGLQDRTEVRADNFGGPPMGACGFRGCMGGWGWYGAPTLNVDTINYTHGTVIFDIVDRASGELAWRSTSQQRVDSGDADQARLNAIADDMLRSLPRNTPAS